MLRADICQRYVANKTTGDFISLYSSDYKDMKRILCLAAASAAVATRATAAARSASTLLRRGAK